jgi:hypothetical protein
MNKPQSEVRAVYHSSESDPSNTVHIRRSAVTNLYTWRWPVRPKHVVYDYNKEKKSEQQPKMHVDGSIQKSQIKSSLIAPHL